MKNDPKTTIVAVAMIASLVAVFAITKDINDTTVFSGLIAAIGSAIGLTIASDSRKARK